MGLDGWCTTTWVDSVEAAQGFKSRNCQQGQGAAYTAMIRMINIGPLLRDDAILELLTFAIYRQLQTANWIN
jgi:hypothetical protein